MGGSVHFYIDARGLVTHPGEDDVFVSENIGMVTTERIHLAGSQGGQTPSRVRIRDLVFVLLLVLLGSLPLLDVPTGTASLCVLTPPARIAEAKPTTRRARQVSSNYSLEERDYLIRTIAFEAGNEPDEGKTAVAHVILNRKRSARWADNIKDVVTQPWQFEPWMTRREEMESLSPDDPRYQTAARIADAVLAGYLPDPTAGATHFLNPILVRERRSGSLHAWAQGDGLSIGRQTFYLPDEAGGPQRRVAIFLSAMMKAIFLPNAQGSC
jgi:hypothetical protein